MTDRKPAGLRGEPPASPDWERMASVGRVARAHGRRGEVIVDPRTDFAEVRFGTGSRLFAQIAGELVELRVVGARFHRGRPIVAFDRVADIDGAERLAGAELRIPESALTPLPADAYYEHDLVGCRVETVDGNAVGPVCAVETAAGTARLIVGAAGGGETDVPLVDAICLDVDVASRRIVIDPPPGLLDLNRRPARHGNRPASPEATGP